MVKESLSSDIDFIKEFEQLRLRQKLLINSINKNHEDEHNNLLNEIDKKLDFLVKIFQEVKENDQDDHVEKKINGIQEKQEADQTALLEKLASMEEAFNEKLEDISMKLSSSKVSNSISSTPVEENKDQQSKNSVENKVDQISSNPKGEMPPSPDFKVEKDSKKEKKKWF